MVVVNTKFNEQATRELSNLQMRKFLILFIIVSAFLVLFGSIGVVAGEDIEDFTLGITLVVLGFGFTPLVYVINLLLQTFINKSMAILNEDTTNVFKFDEDKVYQEMTRGEIYHAKSESVYSLIYKVYENENNFFMFISSTQAHIIPKKDIVEGSYEDLVFYFATNLGSKFIRYIPKKKKK